MTDTTVIVGSFKRKHTANEDLLQELKAVIYARVGTLSVAEVLGVLRIIEHEILNEQSE